MVSNFNLNVGLQKLLAAAYILGGPPCSGKSTLAQMLSEQHNLNYYKVDDHQEAHLQRAKPEAQPVMCQYRRRDWNDIWTRPVDTLVSELYEFDKERFPFILDDLNQTEDDRELLVEGAAIWPQFLDGFPLTKSRVIFLIPTPEFQIAHYRQRSWIQPILDACNDPQEAFEHWMKRDAQCGVIVASQANAQEYTTIFVDGNSSLDQLYGQICNQFGLVIE